MRNPSAMVADPVSLTFVADPIQWQQLREASRRTGRRRGEIVAAAVGDYLARLYGTIDPPKSGVLPC